ncbi:hypothetical protein [Sphingomonas montanisoli]|uniref:Uncharacterized protein n=1 Tax=Sphingomonas montanisoli TaxID=2606412 RepID=A0A5D9C2A6_9SPHN|nr:hypothetical protein [Sphingomonas montanisoli]TZG25769.1 hypothetical protein FYJ91_12285 [Sphingomonas montanisoli]
MPLPDTLPPCACPADPLARVSLIAGALARLDTVSAPDEGAIQAAVDLALAEDGVSASGAIGAKLAARVTALLRWRAVQDDALVYSAADLAEAAAVATLLEGPTGQVFDPEGFTDLVAFIAEMPF